MDTRAAVDAISSCPVITSHVVIDDEPRPTFSGRGFYFGYYFYFFAWDSVGVSPHAGRTSAT